MRLGARRRWSGVVLGVCERQFHLRMSVGSHKLVRSKH
jgi:hypothetical protein